VRLSIRLHGRFSVNSGQAALRAAIGGLGIVLLPEALAADDVAAGRLRQILNRYEADTGAIYAVYPSRRHMTAAMRAFLEFIASAVPR
jgi:DNA-binding transcriptional LysR family regulator